MVCFAFCTPAHGEKNRASKTRRANEPSRESIQQISDKIDALVMQKLSDEGLKRNKRTKDSVFVRRVYLDIIGRIPHLHETKAFLKSKSEMSMEKNIL